MSDDLISRAEVLALAKDVTLEGGAKHRCVDATMIPELHSAEPQIVPCEECINEPGCCRLVIHMSRGGETKFRYLSYCSNSKRRTR